MEGSLFVPPVAMGSEMAEGGVWDNMEQGNLHKKEKKHGDASLNFWDELERAELEVPDEDWDTWLALQSVRTRYLRECQVVGLSPCMVVEFVGQVWRCIHG